MNNILKYIFLQGLYLLASAQNITAQSLTLYCFAPPHKINWQNPHTLLTSTVRNHISFKNDVVRRPLGHIMVELKKDSSYILTGMVADQAADLKKDVFKNKDGLGILFKLKKGRLEETEKIRTELASKTQSGKVAFITYNISDTAYEYLKLYLETFKARGYDKKYNGNNKPRMGEGSGCSAFAISFPELINALIPEDHKNWTINIDVPDKLIGGGYTGRKISLLRLLLSFRWSKKNEPSTTLVLYDPYLMYKWIVTKWQQNSNNLYTLKQIDKAKGLEIQCKACKPQFPMFLVDSQNVGIK